MEASRHGHPAAEPKEGDASEKVDERAQRVDGAASAAADRRPRGPADRDDEQHARWLLAYLLDWHRREDKAGWWEYFRLRDLPEEDLFDEPQAIAGLEYVERVGLVPDARTGSRPARSSTATRIPSRRWRFGARTS